MSYYMYVMAPINDILIANAVSYVCNEFKWLNYLSPESEIMYSLDMLI